MQTLLQTPTPNLEQSLDFYRRVGFQRIDQPDRHLVHDGKVIIEINPVRTSRTAIRIRKSEGDAILAKLPPATLTGKIEGEPVFTDPNGIQLIIDRSDDWPFWDALVGTPLSRMGNFAGISIESLDLEKSVEFWRSLGLTESAGGIDHGWMSLTTEGGLGISLMQAGMCPHLFFNPGLTYFNSGRNLENIASLRESGIEMTEEITCFNSEGTVDNVIVRDPGGTGFFVFND